MIDPNDKQANKQLAEWIRANGLATLPVWRVILEDAERIAR